MSLLKNINTEIKENVENSRQGDISFGLKSVSIPNYLPKPTRPEELDFILSDDSLFKRINGFVIEIQDFYDITQNCRRYKNQEISLNQYLYHTELLLNDLKDQPIITNYSVI